MFKIRIPDKVQEIRRNIDKRISVATISTTPPGISFAISPHDIEKTVARELVIFISDRRVTNSKECCDNCIKNSIKSVLEIRDFLLQKKACIGKFY